MIVWVREHPYLSGTLLVALLILLFLIFRQRGSASVSGGVVYSGPSEGLQAAQIQAGSALQQTQIAANVRQSEINASVNALELTTAADVQKTFLAQQVELERIYGTVDLGKYQTDASKQVALAQIGQMQPLPVQPTTTPVVMTPNYTPAIQYSGGSSSINDSIAPASSVSIGQPRSGETWDQYYARQLSENQVYSSFDPSVVKERNAVYVGSYDAYVNSVNSLPAGDWLDSSGHIQSCDSDPRNYRCTGGSAPATSTDQTMVNQPSRGVIATRDRTLAVIQDRGVYGV